MLVNHIGYLVKDINKSIAEFEKLGYIRESEVYNDLDRGVAICFIINGTVRVELVAPLAKQSPVSNLLGKAGESPYHICYISTDIEQDIKQLINDKYMIVVPKSPAIAFSGKQVVFLYKKYVGLIELVEE